VLVVLLLVLLLVPLLLLLELLLEVLVLPPFDEDLDELFPLLLLVLANSNSCSSMSSDMNNLELVML
jgi:hypothetical protein